MLIALATEGGPAPFGAFVLTLTLGYVVHGLLGMGLSGWALRLAAEPRASELAATMGRCRLATAILGSAFVGGIMLCWQSSSHTWQVLGAVVVGALDTIMDLAVSLLAGRGAQGAASVAIIVQRGLPLLGMVIGMLAGDAFLGVAVGATAGLAFAVPLVWTRGHGTPLRSVLHGARGYWIASLATNASQLDSLLVSSAVGLRGAGIFGAGSRIGGPLNIVTNSLLSLVVPTLASLAAAERRAAVRRLLPPVGVYAAVLVVLSPVAASGLVALLGDAYQPGWPVYTSLVIGAAISSLAQVRQAYLFAAGGAGKAGLVLALCAPLGLAGIYSAGHLYGLTGIGLAHIGWQAFILAGFMLCKAPEDAVHARHAESRPSAVR
ncbi:MULTISPECIES: lipopolysaccharide biosynthesis protein [unclassified Blastococcus]